MSTRGSSFITPVAQGIPFDNSTNGWVANNVQAAIEEAPIHLRAGEVSSTATYTTTTTDALVTGMTTTPVAGTYLVWFSCDANSTTAGAAVSMSYYVGGVQKADSLRKVSPLDGGLGSNASARCGVAINGLIAVNGSQAIEVRASASTAGQTIAARTMNWLRID